MESTSTFSRMAITKPSALQLYSAATPNGLKVAIMLEELADLRSHKGGFEYEPHTVDIRHGENRSLSFTHYCPPGKIPVIVDPATDGQPEATVWESGSILLYLSEKYHELLPLSGDDPKLRQETINWLFWASASFSPKVKTLGFYYKYCPHKLPYCISRYVKECNRLLHILEKQFAHNKQYIVGDSYTIADIAVWPWIHAIIGSSSNSDNLCEVHFNQFRDYPLIVSWHNSILHRTAVQRALQVTPFFN